MTQEELRRITCAFTGHRPYKLPGGGREGSLFTKQLKANLAYFVEEQIKRGRPRFLCGMAQGFDLFAAETVLNLQEKYEEASLVAVIPYPGQAARWDGEWKSRYYNVLAGCDGVETISEKYFRGCEIVRDHYLVDHASALICFYTGAPGGTAHTVQRALDQGLENINIYEEMNV